MSETSQTMQRRWISTREAFQLLGVGRTKGFAMLHAGRVAARRFDGRLLVDRNSIDAFLNGLPEACNTR